MSGPLDFDGVLGALMERVDTRVRISVFAAHLPRPAAQVVDIEGVLTAGWDPAVLAANGFEGSAIFRVQDAPGFSLYLVRDDFTDAQLDGDRLYIRTGGIAVAVGPPLEAQN